MKKDIADRWVAALRSGKYLQGEKNLLIYRSDADSGDVYPMHCALGVLCEIAVEEGVVKRHDDPSLDPYDVWLIDEGEYLAHTTGIGAYVDPSIDPESLADTVHDASHGGFAQVLPEAMVLWAEMSYNDGRSSASAPITALNDNEQYSFDRIARHIETYWELL